MSVEKVPQLMLVAVQRSGYKLPYWEQDRTADLILSAESFEYATSHGFKTARSNLKGMALTPEILPSGDPFDRAARPQPDPSHLWVRLYFAKRTAKGKSLTIGVDPLTLVLLHRYVEQKKRNRTLSSERRRSRWIESLCAV